MTMRSNVLIPHDFHKRPSGTCSQASSLSTCTKSSPGAEISHSEQLPNSVKGAPAHLRTVIRKRQNSESAKRSRLRRKEAARRFYQRFEQQCQRIRMLEDHVARLAAQLASDDDEQDKTQTAQQNPPSQPQPTQQQPSEEKQKNQGLPPDELRAFEEDLDLLLDSCIRERLYDEEAIYGEPFC